jgi:flagellar biosynthesis protein FlhG
MSTFKVDAHDQAAGLRRLFTARGAQVLALVSSAVVKDRAHMVANAALSLANRGRRVLLLDENPAPRNAASLLLEGGGPGADLLQVLRGESTLAQAVRNHSRNLSVLAVERLANAELPLTRRLADLHRSMVDAHELILIDCSVARAAQISTLGQRADHLVITVLAASNGIMQAYAQIKRLAQRHQREHFQILVQGKIGRDEARIIFNNLRQVASEHLGVRLDYLGLADPTRADMLADLLDSGLTMQRPERSGTDALSAALGLGMGLNPHNSVV